VRSAVVICGGRLPGDLEPFESQDSAWLFALCGSVFATLGVAQLDESAVFAGAALFTGAAAGGVFAGP
jgi:hypothetical protein